MWADRIDNTTYNWNVSFTDGIVTVNTTAFNFTTEFSADLQKGFCSPLNENYSFEYDIDLINVTGTDWFLTEQNVTVLNVGACLFNLTNIGSADGNFSIKVNATDAKRNITCIGNNTITLNTTCQLYEIDVDILESRLSNCTMNYENVSIFNDNDYVYEVSFCAS